MLTSRHAQVKDLNAAKAKVPYKTAQDVDNQIKYASTDRLLHDSRAEPRPNLPPPRPLSRTGLSNAKSSLAR